MSALDRLKRKKEEERQQQELAEVYEDYRSDFQSAKATKVAFVRGEVVNADSRDYGNRGDPVIHQPKPISIDLNEAIRKVKEKASLFVSKKPIAPTKDNRLSPPPIDHKPPPIPVARPPRPGKTQAKPKMSNLEEFKEELKAMQEKRQERRDERERELQQRGVSVEELSRVKTAIVNPYLDSNYSEFSENLSTTNLYISFLPLETTLEDLYETFGSFGPLASARILYPRQNEPRPFMFAFVAYMSRKDAERAQMAMNGAEIHGADIKVNWGKVVDIPEVPFYVPPALQALALPEGPTGLPFNAKPQQQDYDSFISKYGRLPDLNQLQSQNSQYTADYEKMLRNAIVRVVIPTDRHLLHTIHRMIEYVVREGPQFEAIIMSREVRNPLYKFLYENRQPSHVYYRWRLFSVLQGDDLYHWRTDRFRMFDQGSWWEPPPHSLYTEMPPQLYNTAYMPIKRDDFTRKRHRDDDDRRDYESQKHKKRRGALSDDDRDFLEQLLRNLTPKRRHVAFAMCWCLRRARSAKEIVDCVVEALMIQETPLFRKLGRFYLLSDILANCEVQGPDIANFRIHIEPKLESIFVEFNKILKRIPTRINQSQFRTRVASCIQVWSDNTIYPKQSLIHYQNVLLGLSKEFEKTKNDVSSEEEEDVSQYDVSPPSRSGIEDRPSPPADEPVKVAKSNFSSFKASDEWVTVDPQQQPAPIFNKWENEVDEYDQRRTDSWRPEHKAPSRGPTQSNFKFAIQLGEIGRSEIVKASGKSSDEKRKILREIEAKVLVFQDDLEDARDPFINEKVEQYREELLQKADLTTFAESEVTNGGKASSNSTRNSGSSYDNRHYDRERRRERSRSRSPERNYRNRSSSYRNDRSYHRY